MAHSSKVGSIGFPIVLQAHLALHFHHFHNFTTAGMSWQYMNIIEYVWWCHGMRNPDFRWFQIVSDDFSTFRDGGLDSASRSSGGDLSHIVADLLQLWLGEASNQIHHGILTVTKRSKRSGSIHWFQYNNTTSIKQSTTSVTSARKSDPNTQLQLHFAKYSPQVHG